jgi:hypothetical protein
LNSENAYVGIWKFEKNDFKEKHPLMPSFVLNKIMKSRLVLEKLTFTQMVDHKKKLKPTERLSLLKFENETWHFRRVDDEGRKVDFKIHRVDNHFYYDEGQKIYKIIKIENSEFKSDE